MVNDSDWQVNAVGKRWSHKYGFGMINATAAVLKAVEWKSNFPKEAVAKSKSQSVEQQLPDPLSEISATTVNNTISFESNAENNFLVEHIEVRFFAAHGRRGDLEISLVSPFGTISRLALLHNDVHANYDGWR